MTERQRIALFLLAGGTAYVAGHAPNPEIAAAWHAVAAAMMREALHPLSPVPLALLVPGGIPSFARFGACWSVCEWIAAHADADTKALERCSTVIETPDGFLVRTAAPCGPYLQQWIGHADRAGSVLTCYALPLDRTQRVSDGAS